MSTTVAHVPEKFSSFLDALGYLIDPRDPRGKRHGHGFLIKISLVLESVGTCWGSR